MPPMAACRNESGPIRGAERSWAALDRQNLVCARGVAVVIPAADDAGADRGAIHSAWAISNPSSRSPSSSAGIAMSHSLQCRERRG